MQIRRSVSRFFASVSGPAICGALILYFGYYAIWGTRGVMALNGAETRLAMRSGQLAEITADRKRLQHRIELLEPGSVDPDLVEELARGQLMESAPGQVAVPRNRR